MKKSIVVNKERFKLYLSEKKIRERVRELGKKLNRDYRGKVPIFIGVLNGSFIFFADLIREITIDCEVDFFKLSSYGDAKISSGEVRLLKDLNCEVTGRDIIIVEDIVDSGLSIDFIRKLILQQNPRSFAVVTLLYKKDAVKIPNSIEYIGFKIPSDFVIGYGLDYAQKVRNLPAVYKLEK
ncbi:MAG TPA: hypoxanthine phosphoribosyltransferase [Bacteroidota bacterium]|nr:hypoxanthine phosphoribosyltransferase [Bacteroidota bacterium]